MLWRLPNYALEARGDFFYERGGDLFTKSLSRVRAVCGAVILVFIALTHPGFTKLSPKLVPTSGNTPGGAGDVSKLGYDWLTSILYGIGISLPCIVAFAVVIVILTRSGKRPLMLRRMCRPLIAFALFVVILAAVVGTVDLLTWVATRLDGQTSDPSRSLGALGITAETIILIALFVTIVPTLVVLYVKTIYLAAVDVFRADDAHPLLAPFATTAVAWSLASFALIAGGPTRASHGLGLLIVLAGPLTVSSINALECCRLWLKYHDLLFRDGPLMPGAGTPGTTESSPASGIPRPATIARNVTDFMDDWAQTTSSQLPIVLVTRPTDYGEQVRLWLRADITIADLRAASEKLAAACWATEVRVVPSTRHARLATLQLIRNQPPSSNQVMKVGSSAVAAGNNILPGRLDGGARQTALVSSDVFVAGQGAGIARSDIGKSGGGPADPGHGSGGSSNRRWVRLFWGDAV